MASDTEPLFISNPDIPMLPQPSMPYPVYPRPPPPTYEEDKENCGNYQPRSPTPEEGPQPGVIPGKEWIRNLQGLEPLVDHHIPGMAGREIITPFFRYDFTPDYLEVILSCGRNCANYSRPLRTRADPYPCRILTRKEAYTFYPNETFSPMVDFTINGESDISLQGEVQHFRNAHQKVANLAEDLAKLKRLYWNTRWDEYNSLRTLAHANVYRRLEPHILHNAPLSSDIPPAVLNTGIADFTDGWKYGPDYEHTHCEWCARAGHPTERCSQINQCVLCYGPGHIQPHSRHPPKHC